jgi:hypothetical protein
MKSESSSSRILFSIAVDCWTNSGTRVFAIDDIVKLIESRNVSIS